jgi:hypothetical protein
MIKIEGQKLKNFSYKLSKKGDLLYEEGPILSHFVNEFGEDFFFYWCDSNKNLNRWLLFKIHPNYLKLFFFKEINLKELIKRSHDPFVYFVDIDNNLKYKNIFVTQKTKIPSDYLPSNKFYFDEKNFEDYAMFLEESYKNIAYVFDTMDKSESYKKLSKAILGESERITEKKIISLFDEYIKYIISSQYSNSKFIHSLMDSIKQSKDVRSKVSNIITFLKENENIYWEASVNNLMQILFFYNYSKDERKHFWELFKKEIKDENLIKIFEKEFNDENA